MRMIMAVVAVMAFVSLNSQAGAAGPFDWKPTAGAHARSGSGAHARAARAAPANGAGPEGMWLVRGGRGRVEVAPCEQDEQALCGKIVWVRPGEPEYDGNRKKIIGMLVAYGMRKTARNEWKGRVYDPEKGKDYNGYINLTPGGNLKVTGCLVGFLCQSKYWKRLQE